MFYYFLLCIVVFLVGFFCGRIWENRLENKTVPMKTVLLAVFLVFVIGVAIFTFPRSRKGPVVDTTTLESEPTVSMATVLR
jgi:membrane protein DedA with SNARE-associated domain